MSLTKEKQKNSSKKKSKWHWKGKKLIRVLTLQSKQVLINKWWLVIQLLYLLTSWVVVKIDHHQSGIKKGKTHT